MGKDGRVRPVAMHQRRINSTQWMPPPSSIGRSATTITTPAPATIIATSAPRIAKASVTETTFPVNSNSVSSKLAVGNSAPMIPPHLILEDLLPTSHAGTATNTAATSDAASTDTVTAYVSGREQIQALVEFFPLFY